MNFPGKHAMRRTLGRMAWRDARCCFVLSTGRTGSLTLTSLLNLSPRIRAFHEPPPQLLAESRDAFENVRQEPERFQRAFLDAKAVEIGVARICGELYAETSNRLTYFAPVIAHLLPRAKFIFLHRHPAEVVRSGMRRGYYRSHPWDAHRVTPGPRDPAFSEWPVWDCFEKTCWFWSAINEFSLEFMGQIPTSRGMTLRFEDLMDVDSGSWRTIYEFLNVDPPHVHAVREVLGRRDNQQHTGEFASPSEWDAQQWETLRRIAGQTAKKLGYEIEAAGGCDSVRWASSGSVPACMTQEFG